jgi:hypothetical protein
MALAVIARQLRPRLAAISPRAAAFAGYVVFLLYAYPGYMSSDSVDQLADSRVGDFTDMHAPVMTEIWRLVGYVVSGPFGMLALQGGLLLAGAIVLLERVMARRSAAIAACGAILFPPVLATMAVVWPDSQLAAFATAGTAAITSPKRTWQCAGLGLLFVAAGLRDGAAFAIAPVVVLSLAWRTPRPAWQRYAVAIAAWLAVVGAAASVRNALLDSATERAAVELAIRDIAGVVRYADGISDAEVRAALVGLELNTTEGVAMAVADWNSHPARITNGPGRWFDAPETPSARAALFSARAALRAEHPVAYLRHRWRVFTRVLAFGRPSGWDPVYTGFTGTLEQRLQVSHASRHSTVQSVLVAFVSAFERTLVFKPYLYALLAFALLGLAITWKQRLAAALLGSGLLYEAVLGIIVVKPEFRLSNWMIVATAIAGALLAGVARERRRAS